MRRGPKLKIGSRVLVVNIDGSLTCGVVDRVDVDISGEWVVVRNTEGAYSGFQRTVHQSNLLTRVGNKWKVDHGL